MNEALPAVSGVPARDHAPPERGQEPAPSDAFAAALGAAQPAEAPPPAADPTARTAPAEGTKAEGDSSGRDTEKTADAGATTLVTAAAAVVLPQAAPPAAPAPAEAGPAAVAAGQAGAAPAAAAPGPVAAPATGPAAQVTTPPAAAAQDAPAAASTAAGDPAMPATAPHAAQKPAADAAAPAEAAQAAETAVAGARSHRPGKARAVRAEHVPGPAGESTRPHAVRAGAPHAAGPGRTTVQAQPADRRSAEAPAQTQAADPADQQTPVTARADEPARIGDRPAADQPQQATAPRVRVRDVPDVARATLRVAVRQNGSAMARISLHPADLGGVRITMRVHDGAVSATLAAETPAAAQALTQTASDLRRSLEGQGLQIASLDVHVAGDGPASSGDRRQGSDLARAMSTTTDRAASEDVADITTELHLVPLGTQVDVLA
ncbi:MAG TPA: flagellar hook-length control protein FliK [Gaiellales bacterium]|nr:flagellar hook-length control protein FliK [Gaiellales bacterium]